MRRRWLLPGAVLALASALVVVVVITAAMRDREPRPTSSRTTSAVTGPQQLAVLTPAKGVTADCRTRSEADFGPAFTDPGNLVVGPLAMIGAADLTSAGVVRRFGGQKYPLLVKAGHTVTVEVLAGARPFAGLGYGPLPQGEITLEDAHASVTFKACGRGEESGSSADG